jgi:hypothetical protein
MCRSPAVSSRPRRTAPGTPIIQFGVDERLGNRHLPVCQLPQRTARKAAVGAPAIVTPVAYLPATR